MAGFGGFISILLILLSFYQIIGRSEAINCTADPSEPGCSVSNPLNLSSQIGYRPSGEYYFKIAPEIPTLKLYMDMSTLPTAWVRLNYKISTTMYPTSSGFQWSLNSTRRFIELIKDFGFSDDINKMNTSFSWIMQNASFSTGWSQDLGPIAMNVFNGLTPTGTIWSIGYAPPSYLYIGGTLRTYGTYTNIWFGCATYKNLGDAFQYRSGGDVSHTGEYIHGACNDYSTSSYSITSKVDYTNNRVFWAAFSFYLDSMTLLRSNQ